LSTADRCGDTLQNQLLHVPASYPSDENSMTGPDKDEKGKVRTEARAA
jgi:hypothetical protein